MTKKPDTDKNQVGVTEATREVLKDLADDKRGHHMPEMVDAYRLCIAVACAHGLQPEFGESKRTTMFGNSTLDTDNLDLRTVLCELYPEYRHIPYRVAESLAEQGAQVLSARFEGPDISFSEIATSAATNE